MNNQKSMLGAASGRRHGEKDGSKKMGGGEEIEQRDGGIKKSVKGQRRKKSAKGFREIREKKGKPFLPEGVCL